LQTRNGLPDQPILDKINGLKNHLLRLADSGKSFYHENILVKYIVEAEMHSGFGGK